MKTASTRHVVYMLLLATLLCGSLNADTKGAAPQFSGKTLDGQTVSNSSLSGNYVLLEFFTTWCPVCRADQPAVDNIASAYSNSGLVVVAIDDGEPESVVRNYLQASPRSTPIVVNADRSIGSRFGVHSYPHYVLLDRNGNVVLSRSGGGGEPYLHSLLRYAGLRSNTDTVQADSKIAPAPSSAASPQLVNIPMMASTVKAKPIPKTVFVFTDGQEMEADHYTLQSSFLHVTAGGQDSSIPISSLDIKKTIAVNHERGIDIKIPTSKSEVFLAF